MRARDWLLRAFWWNRSGERVLQVWREPGLENQEGRGPETSSSRPGSRTWATGGRSCLPPRQASRRAYLPPPAAASASPASPASKARRRTGGDFKCSHPSRCTSPSHVTAAWRRPCPPRPDPASLPLPEGAHGPPHLDGAVIATLHLPGKPGRNLFYRHLGHGPHPTWIFLLVSSTPSAPLSTLHLPLPRLWGSFYDSGKKVAASSLLGPFAFHLLAPAFCRVAHAPTVLHAPWLLSCLSSPLGLLWTFDPCEPPPYLACV